MAELPQEPASPRRVIGFMVCGPNEKYLKKTLDCFKRLCDDVVVAGNNTDEKTERTIKDYGFWFYRDDREWGKEQPNIKTDLLKKIGRLRPDVVVPLDADERFDSSYTRELLEFYSRKYNSVYFYIVNHWNSEERHRRSMGFWNIRQFNYLPEYGVQYQRKNLHCGLGPPWAYHYGSYAPHFIHHLGLMDPEARRRKVERYEKYDPQAKWKDRSYYEALKSDTTGSEFSEKVMLEQLREEVSKMGSQKKTMFSQDKERKFVIVRRFVDGKQLDMTTDEWADISRDPYRKKQFELLGDPEDPGVTKIVEPPQTEPGYACPVCGKEFKALAGLNKHKKSHL